MASTLKDNGHRIIGYCWRFPLHGLVSRCVPLLGVEYTVMDSEDTSFCDVKSKFTRFDKDKKYW